MTSTKSAFFGSRMCAAVISRKSVLLFSPCFLSCVPIPLARYQILVIDERRVGLHVVWIGYKSCPCVIRGTVGRSGLDRVSRHMRVRAAILILLRRQPRAQ